MVKPGPALASGLRKKPTTYTGNTQFDACVTNGLTRTQPGCPAVRSIKSTECEPSARRVCSYPPENVNLRPGSGSQTVSSSAPLTVASKFRLIDVRSTISEI